MNRPRTLLALLAILLLGACSSPPHDPYFDQFDESGKMAVKADERLKWWRDARFGMFIHWGLYAIPAGEWKGRSDHGEWILTTGQIPVDEYEKFEGQFNPVKFNANEWVAIAKNAGMKYIVITSKHHDGFALFDSKQSDYDVMSTPFGRDILKELSEATRKQGLVMCWYHSIMDWHHSDYLPRRDWEKRPAAGANFDRYVRYLHGQVRELLSNYGPIGVMWFDGEWESTWNHDYGQSLYDFCRRLQPNVIVNNRVDVGRGGMAGMTAQGNYAGDFGTPEQEIPATGFPGVDWETCMTMNEHWGYNRADVNFKSSKELTRMLCDIASKGGNFLLNVGPTAEGLIPTQSIERLREIGQWMSVNGEAIYGTSASPFAKLDFGRCTVKRNEGNTTLYFHIFDWPKDGTLLIPGLGNEFTGAKLLATGAALEVRREESDVKIQLPAAAPDAVCSVVELNITGAPILYEPPTILTASEIFVMPTIFSLGTSSKDLEIRYTLDGSTPTADSEVYTRGRIPVLDTTTVKARAFHHGKPVSTVTEKTLRRVSPVPGAFLDVASLLPGLVSERFEGAWDQIPDFTNLTPVSFLLTPAFRVEAADGERFARRISGWINIPEDNVYRFVLDSDDGSALYIDGTKVIDNDGLHPSAVKSEDVALGRGSHRIRVEYFNKVGGKVLSLAFARVGEKPVPVPETALRHLQPEEPARDVNRLPNEPGLSCEVFEGEFKALPAFDTLQATSKKVVDQPVLESATPGKVAMRFKGFLAIPEDGLYTITLGSDDGARFTIDTVAIIENDGVHLYAEKSASRPLAAGNHAVVIEYFNADGDGRLDVKIGKDAETPRTIPGSWWKR